MIVIGIYLHYGAWGPSRNRTVFWVDEVDLASTHAKLSAAAKSGEIFLGAYVADLRELSPDGAISDEQFADLPADLFERRQQPERLADVSGRK